MKTIIVGSNPGHSSNGLTMRNLYKWMDHIGINLSSFTNVSIHKTENNRPLKKSEYELDRLKTDIQNYDKVIALGNTASDALKQIGVQHFKLPHPSPRNRRLNDNDFINEKLEACKYYMSHHMVIG